MTGAASSEPLMVEIIAYAPTAFYHCTHCEVAWRAAGKGNGVALEQLSSSLPSDLVGDYQAVSDWVHELFRVYGAAVVVQVIDAASIEGFFKIVRYGARRFPAVIVGREARYSGLPGEVLAAARREIDRRLASSSSRRDQGTAGPVEEMPESSSDRRC